jgi:ATP-dependent RNA helicase DDX24/MAK5
VYISDVGMSWRRIDTSRHDFGSLSDAVFCGLEEISWSDYVETKKTAKLSRDTHIGADLDMISMVPLAEVVDIEGGDELSSVNTVATGVGEGEKMKKSKKNKKRSGEGEALEGETSNLADEPKSIFDTKRTRLNIEVDSDHLTLCDWGALSLPQCLTRSLGALGFKQPTPIQVCAIPTIMKGTHDVVGSAVTGSGKTLAFVLPVITSLLFRWSSLHDTRKPFCIIFSPTRELAMQIAVVAKSVCQHQHFQAALGSQRVEIVNVIGGMAEQKQQRLLSGSRPVHIIIATPGRLCELMKDESNVALRDLSLLEFLVIDEADRMIEEGHFDELFSIFSLVKEHEKLRSEGKDPYLVHLERNKGSFDYDHTNSSIDVSLSSSDRFRRENDRQTLLFSATATSASTDGSKSVKIGEQVPKQIKKLMDVIAVKKQHKLIDTLSESKSAQSSLAPHVSSKASDPENGVTLPSGLTQYEFRVTTEEKDAALYYYLYKNMGRILIFVNAIATAKRVDGLLRALGFNSRTIHGQLEQKQRFRAIENFKSTPIGILVATDVAARGLDIPKINHVVHYDIARTPQAYIHRSGRTARTTKEGSSTGATVSIVSPEDASFHSDILKIIPKSSFSHIKTDTFIMSQLDTRVTLAKKVSFMFVYFL